MNLNTDLDIENINSEINRVAPSIISEAEKLSYKTQYLKEKEINGKLCDKLSGYKTIVKLFSKDNQEKSILKVKIAHLEKALQQKDRELFHKSATNSSRPVTSQEQEFQFADLPHEARIQTNLKTSSPSFVVIDKCGNEVFRQRTTSSPVSFVKTGQQANRQDAELVPPVKYNSRDSRHVNSSQLLDPKRKKLTSKQTISTVQVGVPLSETDTVQVGGTLSDTVQVGGTLSHIVQVGGTMSEIDTVQVGGTLSDTVQVGGTLSDIVQVGGTLSEIDTVQVGGTLSDTVQVGGLLSLTAWAGQTVKPQGKMEQEKQMISNKDHPKSPSHLPHSSGSAQHIDTTMIHSNAPSPFESVLNQTPLEVRTTVNPTQVSPSCQNHMPTFYKNIHSYITNQPQGSSTDQTLTAPIDSWGIGARPKTNNTAADANAFNPTISATMIAETMPSLYMPPAEILSVAVQNYEAEILESPRQREVMSFPNVQQPLCSSSQATLSPLSHVSHTNDFISPLYQLGSTETWVEVTAEEELIKFPSLKTSQSPGHTHAGGMNSAQVFTTPSDQQQPPLASQMESMVAELKILTPSQSGISDMLYQFAKTAGNMEKKIDDYQALIQRQQVQIQSRPKYEQEVQNLRRENERLLNHIQSRPVVTSPRVISEHGWTAVETPLIAAAPYEQVKKFQILEQTNAKLFMANKEWFNKWESLRQHTKDEKTDLETTLQFHVAEMGKLKKDVVALESQLSDVCSARQEAIQSSLELEQEKLNLLKKVATLKTEVEQLNRENRQLDTEIGSLKNDAKLKGAQATVKGADDTRVEMSLLKQQLAVFHGDFQKEREDRSRAECKVEKYRRERESMKSEWVSKQNKLQSMLKVREDELRLKSKQLAQSHLQVEDLKIQLQREHQKSHQSRSAIYEHAASTSAKYNLISGGMVKTFPVTIPQPAGYHHNHTYPMAKAAMTGWVGQSLSPENMPGAWQCHDCTYINFPERTVCDICGWQNVPGNTQVPSSSETPSGRSELHSRGDRLGVASELADVVPDTDLDAVK